MSLIHKWLLPHKKKSFSFLRQTLHLNSSLLHFQNSYVSYSTNCFVLYNIFQPFYWNIPNRSYSTESSPSISSYSEIKTKINSSKLPSPYELDYITQKEEPLGFEVPNLPKPKALDYPVFNYFKEKLLVSLNENSISSPQVSDPRDSTFDSLNLSDQSDSFEENPPLLDHHEIGKFNREINSFEELFQFYDETGKFEQLTEFVIEYPKLSQSKTAWDLNSMIIVYRILRKWNSLTSILQIFETFKYDFQNSVFWGFPLWFMYHQGKLEMGRALFTEMTTLQIPLPYQSLVIMISAEMISGNHERAQELLQWSGPMFNSVCCTLLKHSRPEQTLKIYQSLQFKYSFSPNINILTSILENFVFHKQTKKGHDWIMEELQRFGFSTDGSPIWKILLDGYISEGMNHEAHATLEKIPEYDKNSNYSANARIQLALSEKDFQLCEKIYNTRKALGRLDAQTITSMICCYMEQGEWKKIESLILQMKELKFSFNHSTSREILKTVKKLPHKNLEKYLRIAFKYSDAHELVLLQEYFHVAFYHGHTFLVDDLLRLADEGKVLHKFVWNSAIRTLFDHKILFRVKKVLDAMERHQVPIDSTTYLIIISGFLRNSEPELARHYLLQMKKENLRPEKALYSSLFHHKTQNLSAQDVYQELAFMQQKGYVPDTVTWNILLTRIREEPDCTFEKVWSTYCQLRDKMSMIPDVTSMNILLKFVVSTANSLISSPEEIEHQLNLIVDEMSTFRIQPNSSTFSLHMNKAAKEGNLSRLLELWNNMIDYRIYPTVYEVEICIRTFSYLQFWEICLEFLKKMILLDLIPDSYFMGRLVRLDLKIRESGKEYYPEFLQLYSKLREVSKPFNIKFAKTDGSESQELPSADFNSFYINGVYCHHNQSLSTGFFIQALKQY